MSARTGDLSAIAATVLLLSLAGAAQASDWHRERALALERACKGAEAVKVYRQAAREGDGKAAKRLSEIYSQGIDGVSRDYAEALKWADAARRLGEQAPVVKPMSAGPPPECKPAPQAKSRLVPGTFQFGRTSWPGGGSVEVALGPLGLLFESRRGGTIVESLTVEPSAEQWKAFRESLDRLEVWQWQPSYVRPIPDGTGWSLTIEYADRRLGSNGQNSYPANFAAFVEAVNTLLGGKKF